jgi:hypothetical protein
MGGFGSGGNRSGAGRKPKPKHMRLIDGGADRRGSASGGGEQPPPLPDAPAIAPPDDLSPEERAVWDLWAPAAQQERTLVPATVASFRLLCQLEVDRRSLRDRFTVSLHRSQGTGQPRALLYMGSEEEMAARREHRALARDIKAMLKDFRLGSFGKEIDGTGAAGGVVDPLDAYTRGL